MTNTLKILSGFIVDIDKHLKYIWKHERLQKADTILKRNKVGGPDFKMLCKAVMIEAV